MSQLCAVYWVATMPEVFIAFQLIVCLDDSQDRVAQLINTRSASILDHVVTILV